VVTNSIFTREHYPDISNEKLRIIPLGIDFNLFRPLENKEELRHKWNIRENSVCFIGAAFDIKGWNLLRHVMEKSPHINFVLVMKDHYNLETANMRVFNKVPHSDLVEIINCCKAGICTSEKETQHLAGLEMGACGVPIITSDVGVYYKREPGEWGFRYGDPIGDLNKILSLDLNPRDYWLKEGYDLETCRKAWQNVINEL
jgi:glycosyltransferase involved in cell wall biosynthesis